MSAEPHRPPDVGHVATTSVAVDEEVEDRPVVPDVIVRLWHLDGGRVSSRGGLALGRWPFPRVSAGAPGVPRVHLEARKIG